MKRISLILIAGIVLIYAGSSFAQSAEGSWSAGFLGLTYPRFEKTTVSPANTNYGYHAFLQRNFSLNTALRIKGSYLSMRGDIPGGQFSYTDGNPVPGNTEVMKTNLYVLDLDFIYKLIPLSFVSPYAGAGAGITLIDPVYKNEIAAAPSGTSVKPELNLFAGIEWSLNEGRKLVTEVGYHLSNGNLDGIEKTAGANSFNQSYLTISAGLKFCLTETNGLMCCVHYKGLSASGNIPPLDKGVDVKEAAVKPVEISQSKEVDLFPFTVKGLESVVINFKFDQSNIQPDYETMLYQAARTLKLKQKLKLEIRGYTDNIGSAAYNTKLSEKRAETVENYFLDQGISADRLAIKGFGETMPIAGNNSRKGREENRRVNFKIK